MLGQPRRAIGYPTNLTFLNEWSSVSAFVLGGSMLVFLANVAYSLVIAPKPAEANPWGSNSLEWQTASPPPAHNFDVIPEIGMPHLYGFELEPAAVEP
jgi:heme/copper-type cytochrome/quinol oxidase subunit 1